MSYSMVALCSTVSYSAVVRQYYVIGYGSTVSYSMVVLSSSDHEGLHFLTDQKPALQYLHGTFAVLLRYKVQKCLQCKLKCVQYVAMN